jgi:hypothetical protein
VIRALAVLAIPSGYIHNSLEMVFLRGFVLCVIVRKLCCRQQLYPVVLVPIDIVSQVRFDRLVHSFALSIRLWVVCRRHFVIYSEFCCERFPKLACEQLISVGDKLFGSP